ncbi:uncharacterized protein TNCV_4294151 [Trichonephila clavipes]|uniref:Uncharacterized protein n=1 Tax=Trichonephila clavipes TaxID=2585209 RepID=A0A8X6RGU4_TRICX|nr:uncharacterized protein TNCV_4294151 [Trichonephila clavipes]
MARTAEEVTTKGVSMPYHPGITNRVDWKYTRIYIPKKTPKKISGKVPYRFVTSGATAHEEPRSNVPMLVFVTLCIEVHKQMSRSGGQSEVRPPVLYKVPKQAWFLFIDPLQEGHGSQVVKVSDRGLRVMSSSPVRLKTRRVGKRCTLNLSRAQTSSFLCSVVWQLGEVVPAQVSSSSLDHGSKLRGPLPKALV